MPFTRKTHLLSLVASLVTFAFAAQPSAAHDDPAELGDIDFDVACTDNAGNQVKTGTLLLHHMMYVQARERFQAAAATDPECAMAYWGIAMSNFHPMWPGGQSDEELASGVMAMDTAAKLEPGSAREKDYIAAAAAFYAHASAPYPQRLAAWAEAQQDVFTRYPDDTDAGAFAALAMLSVAPKGDASFAVQREAGALLEQLFERAPNHPGVFHYVIHAYDHPPLAAKAERFAAGYDAIAPEVPHALHMPSHIFVRLGRWEEGAEWNRRSAAAALDQPMNGGVVSNHYPHAIDYLVYSLLQSGDVEEAQRRVEDLLATPRIEDSFGSAYALTASPARMMLEGEDWAGAAALPDAPHDSISWNRFPQAVAITWFAKGLGSVRTGDGVGTDTALSELNRLQEIMDERGLGYWVALADAQIGTIEAWRAFENGDIEVAIKRMREAADVEDRMGKAPVTPGHVLPARELLGDMLAASGRPAEAEEAYEAALAISPNRRRSLAGLSNGSGETDD